MTSYRDLRLRPLINAYATVTKYGGSLMPPEVLTAMGEAARAFVDLAALQRSVGQRLAELTRNEAAYVTSGAAAGIMLSGAAAVLRKHPEALHALPDLARCACEAIVIEKQRNPYDYAIKQVGLTMIEIEAGKAALQAAINDKTACVFWFPGRLADDHALQLDEVIAIAGAHALPVIVDAAAQLPPVENLWRFTGMGAALAIFSGGKDLRGPQSSGLMLGSAELIDLIRPISNPNHGFGRPLKVGKEEMMGLLAAVERYLELDHEARHLYCEDTVAMFCAALNPLPGIVAERAFPNEAGQPLPWCLVSVDAAVLGCSADAIVQAFLAHEPAIAVSPLNEAQFHLNPMTLQAGEELIVRDACLQILLAR